MDRLPPVVSYLPAAPEELASAIRDARLTPCQLSSSPSLSRITHVRCAHVSLDIASISPAMLFSGSMSNDCHTLVYVMRCMPAGRSFDFSIEFHEGHMGIFPPGGTLDAYTPAGYEHAALAVPSAMLLAAMEWRFPRIRKALLRRGGAIRVGTLEQMRLSRLLHAIKIRFADPQRPLVSESARKQLEEDLLDRFLSALASGYASEPRPASRLEVRMRRLRQARDYVEEHLHQPIHLGDLCAELRMSKRSVQEMFHDMLGIGPNAFIRSLRLHAVRRALQHASFSPGVVKKHALDWGFWHLGHFAQEYRVVFGETPSTTLAHQLH